MPGLFVALLSFARTVLSLKQSTGPTQVQDRGYANFLERCYGEVRRVRLLRASVSKKLLAYSRAVDLRIRRAGRPPRLPLQARGLPPHTLRRTARLFAQDLGEC